MTPTNLSPIQLSYLELFSARSLNRSVWILIAAQAFSQSNWQTEDLNLTPKSRLIFGEIERFDAALALARLMATQPRSTDDLVSACEIYGKVWKIRRARRYFRHTQTKLHASTQLLTNRKSLSHDALWTMALILTNQTKMAAKINRRFRFKRQLGLTLDLDIHNPFNNQTQTNLKPKWKKQFAKLINIESNQISFESGSKPALDRLVIERSESVSGELVSIVMPTFNPGSEILTAIRSLILQTYTSLEILVVDDGSDDNESLRLLNEIEKLDQRVRVLHLENNFGTYVARNIGMQQAQGRYITFHDSDDFSMPRKIERSVSKLESDGQFTSVLTNSLLVNDQLIFSRTGYRANKVNLSSIMFDRKILEQVGYFEPLRKAADTEFISRLSDILQSKPAVVTEFLSLVRRGQNSLTSTDLQPRYMSDARMIYRSRNEMLPSKLRKGSGVDLAALNVQLPLSGAIPKVLRSKSEVGDPQKVENLIVGDCFHESALSSRITNAVDDFIKKGKKVHIFHVPSLINVFELSDTEIMPELNKLLKTRQYRKISADILKLTEDDAAMFLIASDKAHVENLYLFDTSFLDHQRDSGIAFQVEKCHIDLEQLGIKDNFELNRVKDLLQMVFDIQEFVISERVAS
jgi:glycosyltransferase involved in cell wall biosynthesis